VNGLIRAEFMLVAEIFLQVCVTGNQTIQHRDSRRLDVSLFRLKSFRLGLKGCLLDCEELASRGEAVALALPVEASLEMHNSTLALSEARVVLAPNGAPVLASRQRVLALSSAQVLFLLLRTILALSVGSRSGATIASLSTHRDALALALRDRRG